MRLLARSTLFSDSKLPRSEVVDCSSSRACWRICFPTMMDSGGCTPIEESSVLSDDELDSSSLSRGSFLPSLPVEGAFFEASDVMVMGSVTASSGQYHSSGSIYRSGSIW